MVEAAVALRQGGAHRRQLGQPRPGAADRADGRERAAAPSRCEPQQVMYQARSSRRRSSRRGAPRRSAWRPSRSSCRARCRGVQDLISVYRALARALRLPAAPRPDRGRHGHQGHGRVDRGAGGAAAGRHRRHDPRLADAAAGRGAHAGGGGRARDPAVARPALVQPERHRLPGLRPHDEHDLPGAGQADRRLPARADAGLEGALSRRRER